MSNQPEPTEDNSVSIDLRTIVNIQTEKMKKMVPQETLQNLDSENTLLQAQLQTLLQERNELREKLSTCTCQPDQE